MADKILSLIKQEEKRQAETLMLIPSENYTYSEVREAVGSVLMHKYAEGQPSKRYYQGNVFIDEIEKLAQKRALSVFNLSAEKWSANVQAHSGSPANLAVFNALLKPGDKIMSMYLPEGGHLSHGWHLPKKSITLVSKIYQVAFYHVDPKSQVFDYEKIEEQVGRRKPRLIISGGTAYPREIDHAKMARIAKKIGAFYLADIAHEAGLIAGGINKSPFPHADVVTMTTHKTLRGPRGAIIISRKPLSGEINSALFPGLQGGPHINNIAGIAITLKKAKSQEFKRYARQVVANARVLGEALAQEGFILVAGGTDKHLLLLDLRNLKMGGKEAAEVLEEASIVVNKNTVPSETGSPWRPSGIRLGTPAVTARGMKEKQMYLIAGWITEILKAQKNPVEVKSRVRKLCRDFPLPK